MASDVSVCLLFAQIVIFVIIVSFVKLFVASDVSVCLFVELHLP